MWPAGSTQAALRDRRREPARAVPCFPHPIRPSATFPSKLGRGTRGAEQGREGGRSRPRRRIERSRHPPCRSAVFPDAPALIKGDRALSYAGLSAAIHETAADLGGWGVRPGDRVMIVMENAAAAPILMFAAQALDAWPAIVNARMAPPEIEALRALIGPKIVVAARASSIARRARSVRCSAIIAIRRRRGKRPEAMDGSPPATSRQSRRRAS